MFVAFVEADVCVYFLPTSESGSLGDWAWCGGSGALVVTGLLEVGAGFSETGGTLPFV